MKKLIYLFSIISVVTFTSCSSDDDAAPANVGSFTFNGKETTILSAEIDDFGPEEGFHNYEFYFEGTDGTTETEVELDLYSPLEGNETGFKPGTFNYNDETGTIEPGTYYFSSAIVRVDGEPSVFANGGQVVVAGTGNNYTVTADLTFADDSTLTLTYSGAFIVFPFIDFGN